MNEKGRWHTDLRWRRRREKKKTDRVRVIVRWGRGRKSVRGWSLSIVRVKVQMNADKSHSLLSPKKEHRRET